jgi:hypothetical protein
MKMKVFSISGFLFLFIILLMSSCYYDSKELLYPQTNYNCDTTNVTYSSSVVPVLEQYCLGCHNNTSASSLGGNLKLENYPDVKIRVDDGSLLGAIRQESGYSAMPKGASKIDNCKITIIEKWVESGAANN